MKQDANGRIILKASVGGGLFAADGSVQYTDQTSNANFCGAEAPDGSLNVTILTTESIYTGLYAKNGSVNVVAGAGNGIYSPCGAWNVSGINPYDPAAVLYFARIPTQTSARYSLLNTVFVSLRAAGLLALLDALWLMAAADASTARANLISSSYTLTPVASPVFTADQGYTGDASSAYLNTNYNPSTAGGLLTQNSGHISAYNRSNRAAATKCLIGNGLSSLYNEIFPLYSGTSGYVAVSGPESAAITMTNSSGHFIASRTGSSALAAYRNGSSVYAGSVTSSTPQNVSIGLLCRFTGSPGFISNDQIAAASIGAGLTSAQASSLYNIIQTYMTAIGANV